MSEIIPPKKSVEWDYDDIVDHPHHTSTVRKRMPAANRAAQFAPFAALNGHEDAKES